MIQAVQSIRQEFDAKLAQMSKRNARLWLLDEANNLGRKKLSALLQFRSVLAAIKLYTLFPHGKFASDRALLEKALQVCDGLLIPTQTLADLKYSLSIHLSNLYVAHSEFYDALDCLHAIYLTESERSRRGVCLINMARCKLWLRDFSDVAAIIKQVESLGPIDPSVSPYHVAIKVRLALLVGDTKSARAYPEDLTNQTIEMAYLKLVSSVMEDWEAALTKKYEKFLADSKLQSSELAKSFYTFEGLVLGILQDLKKGRAISTTTWRRLSSARKNIKDFELLACANALTQVAQSESTNHAKKFSTLRRMSSALTQLLLGANDFMYQFASVLWLEYLWSKNQKTEFARYFIEFNGYIDRLRLELSRPSPQDLWLMERHAELAPKYKRLLQSLEAQ